jgi:hypothetical protein
MKDLYNHCSTCRTLKDSLAATGREYSATLEASFDAPGSDLCLRAADASDAAYSRFLEAKRDLEQHRDSGKHDY